MNTQSSKSGTLIFLFSIVLLLLSGCVAPVYAAEAAAPAVSDTCVGNGPFGDLFLVITQGIQPGGEQALGEGVTCYNSNPDSPQYWVVENADVSPRSVIPTDGLSQEILEKVMDPSLGGYSR